MGAAVTTTIAASSAGSSGSAARPSASTAPTPTAARATAPTRATLPTTATEPASTASQTTVPEPPSGFVETFDGNRGRDRFATGVYHRDDNLVASTEWSGDHDIACNGPDTQRTIHRDRPDEYFYLCRDHWMTALGDTSGYSIAWFSPDDDHDGNPDTFSRSERTTVTWDVNVTDLGARLWWEVVLVAPGTPYLTTIDWVANTAQIEPYHADTIAVGTGPYGSDGNIFSDGATRDPLGFHHVCAIDPEGCASKAIRRPFSMHDNGNGTITFEFLGTTYTYDGQFPENYQVYFKQHAYTPNKDGIPAGYTTHWDNITIQ